MMYEVPRSPLHRYSTTYSNFVTFINMSIKLLALATSVALLSCTNQNQAAMSEKKPVSKEILPVTNLPEGMEIATLGGGCFWCVEAVYQEVEGIKSVISGYSGGTPETANYKAVGSGNTAHAEVAQITFDPKVISFAEILEIFWNTHNPTTPNRQGNDVGPQYRSVIFYHSPEQKAVAEKSKAEVATEVWEDQIVTEIVPFQGFWEAEDYHQDYYNTVGDRNPYCTFVITPKVAKFQKQFAEKLRKN